MRLAGRVLMLLGALSLAGCVHDPVSPLKPATVPPPASKPGSTANHPRFAPPPGVQSHWDAALGVYVVAGTPHLYYRERTFYRWNAGWSWAVSPNGPWEPTDSTGVPPRLGRYYGQ